MNIRTRKFLTTAVGAAALAATVIGTAAPAQATPVPPTASAALNGTWINVNSATNSLKQIVVAPLRGGAVSVDGFGVCHPTLCEWGRVPATVYGDNVSSTTGVNFQSNQKFLTGDKEWARKGLFGKVVKTTKGLRLVVREQTVFEDGSGRHNYTRTETFARGKGKSVTSLGHNASGYPLGHAPAVSSGLLGSWVNPTPSGSLVGIKITGTTAHPVVQAAGQCSPTACDWGKTNAIAYGATVSSTSTNTMMAPYTFSFANNQLIITMVHTTTGDKITVAEYTEFTDGSGRSNYVVRETLVRA